MSDDPRKTKERLLGLARTTLAKTQGDKLGFLEDKFVLTIAPAVKMHTTLKAAVVWISNHLNPEDVFTPEQLVGHNNVRDITIPYQQLAETMVHIGEKVIEGKPHHTYAIPVLFEDRKTASLLIPLNGTEVNKDVK